MKKLVTSRSAAATRDLRLKVPDRIFQIAAGDRGRSPLRSFSRKRNMPMGGGGGGKDASFMRRAFQNKVNAHPLSILWAPCRAQVLTVSKLIFATVILQPIILRQII